MNHWTRFDRLTDASLRAGRVRRVLVLMWVTCAFVLALGAVSASATILTPTNSPLAGSNFQGGDGNQANPGGDVSSPPDGITDIDWQALASLPASDPHYVVPSIDSQTHDNCFGSSGQKQFTPGTWAYTDCGSGVNPSKDNLLAGWSTVDHSGDTYLYLAFNREAQTGNTYLAFELNQRADAFHNSKGADVPCRTDGDLLISYQVNSGGNPPNVDVVVHQWTTLTMDAATGCALTGSVTEISPGPNAEAAVNAGSIPNYLTGAPANFLAGEFGEVAINLSGFYKDQLKANPCFNFGAVNMESHSSTSFDSELKDLIGPAPILIASCAINVDKKVRARTGGPSNPSTDAYADTASGSVGTIFDYKFDVTVPTGSQPLEVTDLHDVLGTATGDPAFCSPSAPPTFFGGDTNNNGVVDPGEHWLYTCSYTSVAGDPARSPLHNTAFVTGRVPNCNGGISVCGATDTDDANATVAKVTPTLTTSGSNRTAGSEQTVGGTITDTATLSGGSNPTGSVTFRVYAPGDTTCQTALDWGGNVTSKTVNVVAGAATSPAFTTTTVGQYRWVASYSGDSNNLGVNGACNDTNELSLTKKATPSLATSGSNQVTEQTVGGTITDTATVSGGLNPTGTVTFTVYAPGDTNCGTPLDWGSSTFSKTVSLSAGQATSPAFTTTAVGTYRWVATYNGDANNNSVAGTCNDPNEFSKTKKAQPSMTTSGSNQVTEQTVGGTISDTATLTGGFGTLGGTVTFQVFAPGDTTCSTPLTWPDTTTSQTVNVAAGSVTSPSFTTAVVGTYRWVATYSGDANNNGVSGTCNDPNEFSKTKKATPSLATDGSNQVTEQTVGGTITDTAHVTGGFNPTGTVTFTAFAPGDTNCATPLDWGSSTFSKTVAIDGSGDATSPAFTTAAVGTYHWVVTYSGDAKNNGVNGACNDANEFSKTKKATPVLATDASNQIAAQTVGGAISDTAHVSQGFNPTGSVTFQVYAPGDTNCATPLDWGSSTFSKTVAIDGSGDATSPAFTTAAVGTYRWIATYNGDAKNNSVAGSCNDPGEASLTKKATPSIATDTGHSTAQTAVTVGDPITDTVTVTPGYDPSGSVTFTLYAPGVDCAAPGAQSVFTSTVPLVKQLNGTYTATSDPYTSLVVGDYYWVASYSGNSTDEAVTGPCAIKDSNEVTKVKKATPTLATSGSNRVNEQTVGGTITDTATISGGNSPTGTITFQVFAPGDTTCDTPLDWGGSTFSKTVTLAAGQASSPAFTTSAVGTYRWVASYSGDANNNSVSGACNDPNEFSKTKKASPSLATSASNAVTPLVVGSGSITDTATVSGGFNPTGTVDFVIYKSDADPSKAVCDGTTKVGQDLGRPLADNGGQLQATGSFTPTDPGTYYWIATYSGDANNNSVAGSCADAGEISLVGKSTPTLATSGSNRVDEQTVGGTITDTATISGGDSPTGSITFQVFAPGDTTCDTPLDWGSSTFSKTVTLAAGQATSPAFTTSAVGTYHWIASYSGDANNNSVAGKCGDDNEFSKTKKDTPTLATSGSNRVDEQTVGGTIADTATISGGFNPTGTITFKVFAPGDTTCDTPLDWGSSTFSKTVTLAAGQATSPAFTTSAVGEYRWIASYSGDANNNSVSGKCGDDNEFSKTKKATPSLATDGSNQVDEQTVGGTISDTAHVTSGFNPTGTVTFQVYAPGDSACDTALDWGGSTFSKTVAIDGSGDATSPAFTTAAVGTYRWVATYNGDANNNSVAGKCGDDNEFSKTKKASPSISTQVSSTKIGLGHSVRDVATVSGGYQVDGGSVTFKVYGPFATNESEPSCIDEGPNANLVTTLGGSALSGGKSTSDPFTPTKVGRYEFVAQYAGDANNNSATGRCGDANEHVDVVAVDVSVKKDANDTHAYDGDKVSFTITAKNVGTDSLKNVTVHDHIENTNHQCETLTGPTGDTDGNSQLDPGETWVYMCTVTVIHSEENAQHQIVNVVHIEGDVVTLGDNTPGPGDHVTSNEAKASVPVFHPAIAIDKTGPATGQAGDKIGYTLSVTNPGDEAFAEATVKIADTQCNGDPVTLLSKSGDATPGTLDPGDVWTFSCSVQTAVGETAVHNVASVEGTDTFGKTVTAGDSADTTLTQPAQIVLPERIVPGTAKLSGPTGCVAKAFNARVRGTKIASVVFFLDGKKVKTLRKPNAKTFFQLRVNPAKMRVGVHRLVANVTFQSGSGTKPKTIRLSFQRCARKLAAPRFTG